MPRLPQTPAHLDTAPGGVAAVDKAAAVLAAFTEGAPEHSLAELARRTGLYKSAVLRLAASLEQAQLLERLDAGGRETVWRIGLAAVRLHRAYAKARPEAARIQDLLRQLVAQTAESAALHVVRGSGANAQRLCLYFEDSTQPVRRMLRVGDVLPLDKGASGLVLCAFTPALAEAAAPGRRAALARTRREGFAAGAGLYVPDAAGISAPVFRGSDGALFGALTLTMPSVRYDTRWIPAVRRVAEQMSLALAP